MKVLQINAIYEKLSTGRSTKEMHEFFKGIGVESYVASPQLNGLSENGYQIGNKVDWKLHALLSRITGLQAYFSMHSTNKLLKFITNEKFDIIILRNLHSNYINLKKLLRFISENQIPIIVVLHDCWFYTGKCVYYIDDKCDRWRHRCGNCPAKYSGNKSLFFDRSKKMLLDKKKLFGSISRLGVVGVSKWVTEDARRSILSKASEIECIYNWIDLELFIPRDKELLKEKYHLKGKTVVFGVAMSWSRLKGLDVFSGLADVLPNNYQVVLAGDYSKVDEPNPHIKFLGNISDVKTLAELYAMSDVFVNPSVQETFGKTTAEALSCGTPVVAYNGTATPELVGVDGECGILIDDLDPTHYSSAVVRIVNESYDNYKMRCRERAEKLFDKATNIKEYIRLIEKLTGKSISDTGRIQL